jgi:hypothetical protein
MRSGAAASRRIPSAPSAVSPVCIAGAPALFARKAGGISGRYPEGTVDAPDS